MDSDSVDWPFVTSDWLLAFAGKEPVVEAGASLANLLSIASFMGEDSTLVPVWLSTESDAGWDLDSVTT